MRLSAKIGCGSRSVVKPSSRAFRSRTSPTPSVSTLLSVGDSMLTMVSRNARSAPSRASTALRTASFRLMGSGIRLSADEQLGGKTAERLAAGLGDEDGFGEAEPGLAVEAQRDRQVEAHPRLQHHRTVGLHAHDEALHPRREADAHGIAGALAVI